MTHDPYPIPIHFCVRVYDETFVVVREVTLECEERRTEVRCEFGLSIDQDVVWLQHVVGARVIVRADRGVVEAWDLVSLLHHNIPRRLRANLVTEIAGTIRAWVRDRDHDRDRAASWEDPSRLTFARWAAEMEKVGIPPKGEPSWGAHWLFEALCAPPVRTVVDLPTPLPLPANILVNAEVVAEVEALGRELERAILRGVP